MMMIDRAMRLPFFSRLDGHMKEVVQGASVAFLLKVVAAGLSFFLNVVLARMLDAEGAGMYFQALTITTIGSVLGRVGLDNSLVRFTAASITSGDWRSVKGVYRKGMTIALGASVGVAAVTFFIAPWLARDAFSQPELAGVLRWMSLTIVTMSLLSLYSQLLKGVRRIPEAMMVIGVWVPAITLPGTIFLAPHWGVQGAVWAYGFGSLVTMIIGYLGWKKATPQLRGVPGHFDTDQLLRSSMPLFWMSSLQLVIQWSSTLMLSIWNSSADVGIFQIANRSAGLTSFILIAVSSISAPKFAALYKKGDLETLGRIARNSAKLMAIMVSPIVLLFLLIPGKVMTIFGPQFAKGAMVLSILSIGQFVNVATGAVAYVLIMCGYERLMRNTIGVSALVSIGLNAVLIPRYGITGAAIATAITMILQNLIAAGLVWRRLGIMTIPVFGLRAFRSSEQ